MAQINSILNTQYSKHIIVVCGEPSGDLNASLLAEGLKKLNPEIKISAIGGELLRKAGAEIFFDIAGISVMGIFDVIRRLPKFFALKKLILKKIAEEKIDAIILLDFSGFNLRLAKAINKKIPVIYYISPQVWASRPGRIATIKKYISRIIVIFKFEKEFYKKYGVDAEFVGHPLLDIVKPIQEKNEFLKRCGLYENKATIALLPGSRKSEVKNILPIMAKSAELINQKMPNLQFVIARSHNVELNIYKEIIDNFKIDAAIIEGRTYDCLNIADFALVCSGTATLETAIMQKPFVIVYRMNLLNYLLYRPQVKLPYIGMVNIVAGKKIIPEFIQFNTNPEKIAETVLGILSDETKLSQIKKGLSETSFLLGPSNAAASAAGIILNQF
ncbi:MAG: lipid-A-disaccharide synthase [Candidatus Omnitrophica bacterium CG11_big_fil_rev_8_21_14_0_20_42_13]|uniref:Lipid-A-disaccharide synthase n=1 Tax=Candidatus Ghiorseimicrobium undicola TaxID=1974746 RepID=A0A2H0LWT2_9BACT|nr:MAG: lipid-A-disaccharide synthase [Candidatus Omnitrophica bacterium CG11_big_fil_rev_8_21_14_0_20_42_13]